LEYRAGIRSLTAAQDGVLDSIGAA
jgi:hypothetical protein